MGTKDFPAEVLETGLKQVHSEYKESVPNTIVPHLETEILLAHRPEETWPAHVQPEVQHTCAHRVLPMKKKQLDVPKAP